MCGINGIISKDKNKDKLIKSMNEKNRIKLGLFYNKPNLLKA